MGIGQRVFRRFLAYLRPYWAKTVLVVVLLLLGRATSIAQPWLVKIIIDSVIIAGDLRLLRLVVVIWLILLPIQAGLSVLSDWAYSSLGNRLLVDMRRDFFRHIQEVSFRELLRIPVGDTLSRFLNDVGALQNIFSGTLFGLVGGTLTLILTVGALFALNWKLALIGLSVAPLLIVVVRVFGRPVREASLKTQVSIAQVAEGLRENLQGQTLVRLFYMQETEEARQRGLLFNHFAAQMRQIILRSVSIQSMVTVIAMGTVATFFFGSREIVGGGLTIGAMVAFFQYLPLVYGPLQSLASLTVTLQAASAVLGRIFEFLDLPSSEPVAVNPADETGSALVLCGVSLALNGTPILDNISLEVDRGMIAGLTGPSGAGKSTFANVVLGLLRPDAGEVYRVGRDTDDIGAAPQQTVIFRMSVRDNILLGRTRFDQQSVEEAARLAGAHEFFAGLPDGYDTLVGPGCCELSGGEQQLVALARCFLGRPTLMILDEATSSLDKQRQRFILNQLRKLREEGHCVILISHDAEVLSIADHVYRMERGRLVYRGGRE